MLDIQLHCRPVRKDVLLMPNPACCWFGSLQATLFFFLECLAHAAFACCCWPCLR